MTSARWKKRAAPPGDVFEHADARRVGSDELAHGVERGGRRLTESGSGHGHALLPRVNLVAMFTQLIGLRQILPRRVCFATGCGPPGAPARRTDGLLSRAAAPTVPHARCHSLWSPSSTGPAPSLNRHARRGLPSGGGGGTRLGMRQESAAPGLAAADATPAKFSAGPTRNAFGEVWEGTPHAEPNGDYYRARTQLNAEARRRQGGQKGM